MLSFAPIRNARITGLDQRLLFPSRHAVTGGGGRGLGLNGVSSPKLGKSPPNTPACLLVIKLTGVFVADESSLCAVLGLVVTGSKAGSWRLVVGRGAR